MTDVTHAVGGEKLSLTITRKNAQDQVVSQWSVQRWFVNEEEAIYVLSVLIKTLASQINGFDPELHHMVDPEQSTEPPPGPDREQLRRLRGD